MRSKFADRLRGRFLSRVRSKTAVSPDKTSKQTQWKLESLEPRLLMSADAVHQIEGAIDQPGEQDVYEFVVDEKSRFLFDGVNGQQIQWQLSHGADNLFNSRNLSAAGDKFLELDPGTYRLTIDGLQDQMGQYAFRLIGDSAATALQANQSTAGQLSPATQAALYSFSAQAGDRLSFKAGARPAAASTGRCSGRGPTSSAA